MPGLSLGSSAQVKATATPMTAAGSGAGAGSAAAGAWGPGTVSSGTSASLSPTSAAGQSFSAAVIAMGVLVWVRYSLPSSGSPNRTTFDLVLIEALMLHLAVGLPRMWARRVQGSSAPGSITDHLSRATLIILGR